MSTTTRDPRRRTARLVGAATACLAVALGAASPAARADNVPACATPANEAYAVAVAALTGPRGTDVSLGFTPKPGCEQVATVKNVQLKVFAADGSKEDVHTFTRVPAPDGTATLTLPRIERGRRLAAHVLVQTGTPERTYVVRGETQTQERPDLAVAAVDAPAQTLTTRPVDVRAEIVELNGDTAANATVTLLWGPTPLGTTTVSVPAGGRAPVSFGGVALTNAVPVELTVVVSDAAPAETDTTNNTRTRTVDVTEHEVVSRVVLGSWGGAGAQFNNHVFAPITVPPGGPDLEAKAKALEPQLVRIFYNENWEEPGNALYLPQNRESFFRTAQLAHEAGATINITYQSAVDAKVQPDAHMERFAATLEELVRTRGLTNVRWVTIQNEPNTTNLTLEQWEALHRALHEKLVARGLRDHVRIMGGDLVEGTVGTASDHRRWFAYMVEHMNEIVDAYSVHIYWNYWDIPRMEFRLRDVRKIVFEELPESARKPVYVTEFGVRGHLSLAGLPTLPQPGYHEDGTQMQRTNLAAFQQLWFTLLASELGYSGVVKWDAYWGNYDRTYRASHWLIGPAEEGWPLMPAYHAFRMLLQTTQLGWQVRGVDPWATDDWTVGVADGGEKELTVHADANGSLTLVGLDTRARGLNAASSENVAYSIGGLPPGTTFNLGVWNAAANGENTLGGRVTTSPAGVARFEVPLHGAFALTTVPMS